MWQFKSMLLFCQMIDVIDIYLVYYLYFAKLCQTIIVLFVRCRESMTVVCHPSPTIWFHFFEKHTSIEF